MPDRFYYKLIKGKGEGEKMLQVGRKRKRKERKKDKKYTNSIAWILARTSPPAVSFACLKLHHAAKETKYRIGSISEYYNMSRANTGPTVLKPDTFHAVSSI